LKEIIQKIREVAILEGFSEAKKALTLYSEEIQKLHGPKWVEFKTEVKQITKISEADLKEIRKTDKGSIRSPTDWRAYLDVDNKGEVVKGIKNCSVVFDHHPSLVGKIKFNTFLQRVCLTDNMPFMPDIKLKPGEFYEFDDNKLSQVNKWLAHETQQFSKTDIIDSITSTALENNFNPLADKLMSFYENWDEKPRLDTWLFDYLNAKTHDGIDEQNEKEYISRVGAMWMISAIARVFQPGSKVDTMLILEGMQGKGKSSFINDLSLGYFLELTTNLSKSKEVVNQMLGKWIIELPELKALSGDSDANKAFLTKPTDNERLSYARYGKDFPRRCVFIGTTNEDRYLKDITGNRRFWPVKVGKADRKKLKEDIGHLWAEAVQRYLDGERWWFDEDEDADLVSTSLKIQGIKQDYDETVDQLQKYLEDFESVRSLEVWMGFYKGTVDRFDSKEQMRLGKAMRLCGWERSTKRINGKVCKVWMPKNEEL
jgi:putative DNA primase/helicase